MSLHRLSALADIGRSLPAINMAINKASDKMRNWPWPCSRLPLASRDPGGWWAREPEAGCSLTLSFSTIDVS